jgi:hypothetical protein
MSWLFLISSLNRLAALKVVPDLDSNVQYITTTLLISSIKKFVLPTEFYLDLRQQISWHCPFNVRTSTDEVKLQLQTFTNLPHQILFIRSEENSVNKLKNIILYDLWKSVRFLYKNVEQFFAQKLMLQWFAGSSGQRRRMRRPASRPASSSSFFSTCRFVKQKCIILILYKEISDCAF